MATSLYAAQHHPRESWNLHQQALAVFMFDYIDLSAVRHKCMGISSSHPVRGGINRCCKTIVLWAFPVYSEGSHWRMVHTQMSACADRVFRKLAYWLAAQMTYRPTVICMFLGMQGLSTSVQGSLGRAYVSSAPGPPTSAP